MNSNAVKIRQAKTTDLPEIVALFENTIFTVCAKDYSPEQQAAWAAGAKNADRWQKKLETQYFLVAQIK